ncbi:MAG: hypothetical protein ABIN67_23230 [Ferruginibacter sp.]
MKHPTKVVKLNTEKDTIEVPVPPAKDDLQGMAKYREKEGDLAEAAKLYEKILKAHPSNELSYNRLMMIYRKQKDFKNELRVINDGIKAFQQLYTPSSIGKHKNIVKLSKQLNMLTGLTDKKGKSLYDAEPIGKWKKRKQVVLKKLGKA